MNMSGYDYLLGLSNLHSELLAHNETRHAKELRKIIDSASTGTELLMSARHFIKSMVISNSTIDDSVVKASELCIAGIESVLGDTVEWLD